MQASFCSFHFERTFSRFLSFEPVTISLQPIVHLYRSSIISVSSFREFSVIVIVNSQKKEKKKRKRKIRYRRFNCPRSVSARRSIVPSSYAARDLARSAKTHRSLSPAISLRSQRPRRARRLNNNRARASREKERKRGAERNAQ